MKVPAPAPQNLRTAGAQTLVKTTAAVPPNAASETHFHNVSISFPEEGAG